MSVTGREWELNVRHHGNGIGNGNELIGMGTVVLYTVVDNGRDTVVVGQTQS